MDSFPIDWEKVQEHMRRNGWAHLEHGQKLWWNDGRQVLVIRKSGRCSSETAQALAELFGVLVAELRVKNETGATEDMTTPINLMEHLREAAALLANRYSLNLVIPTGVDWKSVYEGLCKQVEFELPLIDLATTEMMSRTGVLSAMLRALKIETKLPQEKPHDIVMFGKSMKKMSYGRLVFAHSDVLGEPDRQREYGMDFFHALREFTTTDKKLGVVFLSRQKFSELLPKDHPLSALDMRTLVL